MDVKRYTLGTAASARNFSPLSVPFIFGSRHSHRALSTRVCGIVIGAMFTTLRDTQATHTTATSRLHLQSMKGEREEEIKKKARSSEGQRLTEKGG